MRKNLTTVILVVFILAISVVNFGLYTNSHITSTLPPPSTQLAQASIPTTGLVAHYTFDEGSGTTAGDSAGSNTATLQNGVEWIGDGIKQSAVKFSEATMAVSAPQDPIGTGSVTISAWIKPTTIPFLGVIVSNNSNGFSFRVAQSFNRLQCTNGQTTAYSANNSISANTWIFVTAVRKDDGTCTIYVNGLLSGLADQPAGPIVTGNAGLFIGRRPAAAYPFDGIIDDLRIYNRALSAEEIMNLYTDGGGVPEPVMHTLTVKKIGSGSIASVPSGIACGTSCAITQRQGTSIVLTALPQSGSTFAGWTSGPCTGTGQCTLILESDTTVEASFISDNPPTVSGNTITAVDCTQTRVQQAIDLATDGMTVIVPVGVCEWVPVGSSGGAVNVQDKSIILKGAGIDQTVITLTNASGYNQSALAVNMNSDKPFRVTGFTFKGDGKNSYVAIYGSSKGFRIDHISNRLDSANPTRLISVTGHTYGVIDHVESRSNQSGGAGMILVRAEDAMARMSGNTAWKRPLTWGGPEAVYIEDSTFTGASTNFTGFATDLENGGRMVFRRNRVTNLEFGSHGAQSSGGRGAMQWEIYDNTFIVDHSVYSVMVWLRGGTGVIFNNIFIRQGGAYGYQMAFDNPRSHTAYGTFGSICNGTNVWDGNDDSSGYPCLDQIGRGPGDPGSQTSVPAYEWNNKTNTGTDVDVVVINAPSPIHIVEGRDYFSDTPRPGYTPYTYPHPLTISGFTSDTGGPIISLPPGTSTETPPPPSTTRIGDFNSDGSVNTLDFSSMSTYWNKSSTIHDLNKDGIVNTLDYSILVQNWTG